MSNQAQPKIEFPPLNMGVPQYQTPHVGYVLLLEKVATTGARFEPLDPGHNILYRGLDAAKYPPLYLLKQDITLDGLYAIRYWTNNRKANWQDTWNYSIKFLNEDPNYPQYIREYILPRSGYTPLARGSSCPSLLSLTLLTPGVAYTSKPTITLSNTNATADCKVTNGVVSELFITDPGTTLSSPIEVTFSGGGATTQATASAFAQPTTAILVKEEMQVLPENDPLFSLYVKVVRLYMTLPGPALDTVSIDPDASGATTTKSKTIVANGTSVAGGGLDILESTVESTDGTYSIQTVKTLTDAGGWPTLVDYLVDEQTAVVIEVQKTVVDVSTASAGVSGLQDGWYVEFKPIDKFKSIKISSQVVSVPGPITYYGSRPLSLPSTLLDITLVADESHNSGVGGSSATGDGATGTVSASEHVDGGLLISIKDGFHGEAVARFTKTFSTSPPVQSDIPIPTQILPSVGTAVVVGKGQQCDERASASGGGQSIEFSGGAELRARISTIGPVLTDGTYANYTSTPVTYTESSGSVSGAVIVLGSISAVGSVYFKTSIPASTPISVPSGTWILDEVKVEQWRLGVWITYTVEVLVP